MVAAEHSQTTDPREVLAALEVISSWLTSLQDSARTDARTNGIEAAPTASAPCMRPLDDLVASHLVICMESEPREVYAYVDQATIDGFLKLVSGSLGAAITVEVTGSMIRLCAPTQVANFDGPDLVALWLGAERLGGSFWCEGGQATLTLRAARYDSRAVGA